MVRRKRKGKGREGRRRGGWKGGVYFGSIDVILHTQPRRTSKRFQIVQMSFLEEKGRPAGKSYTQDVLSHERSLKLGSAAEPLRVPGEWRSS